MMKVKTFSLILVSLLVSNSPSWAEEVIKTVKPIWGAESARTPPSEKPKSAPKRGKEEAVDLGNLTDSNSAPSGTSMSGAGRSMHKSSGVMPNFKFYFDFLYKYRPGITGQGGHGFDSFHQVFMVEVTPTPDLTFITEMSGAPRFYEVDYQTSERFTLRWGKIWVPFDDMSPHNIFGGRTNTAEFFEGFTNAQAFLPDLWADLGVAGKMIFVDSTALAAEGHLYVVNGFNQTGGTDPTGSGAAYPNFQTPTTGADNNSNKAIGGRAHLKFFQRLGVGASFYRGAYTDKGAVKPASISMYGFDTQIRPTSITELRGGIVYMQVGLNPPATKDSYSRGGMYVEFGQKFGTDSKWKFLTRAGMSQNDNRVVDITDKKLLGVTLLRNFGAIEVSLHGSRDFEKVAGKPNYNYGALRVVTAF